MVAVRRLILLRVPQLLRTRRHRLRAHQAAGGSHKFSQSARHLTDRGNEQTGAWQPAGGREGCSRCDAGMGGGAFGFLSSVIVL